MTGFERYRRKNLLTQAELAELLNLSPQAVGKWEKGEGTPTVAMLQKLAELYGVTMEALLRKDYPESGLAEFKRKGHEDGIRKPADDQRRGGAVEGGTAQGQRPYEADALLRASGEPHQAGA